MILSVRQNKGARWLLVIGLSCAMFSVVFGLVAWWIFHDRPGTTTSDVIGVVGIAAALGGAVGALFGQPLFAQWLTETRAPTSPAVGVTHTMLEDADWLAQAVREQWTRAAAERRLLAPLPIPVQWRRSSLPLAGPIVGAVSSKRIPPRFPPVPGLAQTTSIRLRSGRLHDLHAVYGGLASGRLVIVGPPGSGKTSAAVLLVLAALSHRENVDAEDRPYVPVPVMIPVQGWDPARERFDEWVTVRLAETYPRFAHKRGAAKAGALLSAGMLAVILDGFDEIPTRLRIPVLRALSDQAALRLVLLTRTYEMLEAASEAHLVDAAALELQPVDAAVAADYLTRALIDPAPPAWRHLLVHLNDAPDSPIARALGNPLVLTLVRDTYRTGSDVRELLDIAERAASPEAAEQDVEAHLLDRVLPAAYGSRYGERPSAYDLATAERALRYVAHRMNQDGTRDLRWWLIPNWAPLAPRVIVTALVAAPMYMFVVVVGGRIGVVMALIGSLLAGIVFARPDGHLKQRGVLQLRRDALPTVIGFMIVLGLVLGITAGVSYALAGVAVGGSSLWVGIGFSQVVSESAVSLTPLAAWRRERNFALVFMAALGAACAIVLTLFVGVGLVVTLVVGLPIALVHGLMYPETWPARLAFFQIAATRHTPVFLMRFLEDARERGVLRTVGPVYQFRHARLQDRLAGQRASHAHSGAGR